MLSVFLCGPFWVNSLHLPQDYVSAPTTNFDTLYLYFMARFLCGGKQTVFTH